MVEIVSKISAALGPFLPAMQADGGGVVFDHVEGTVVHLRFLGACRFCPSQELTITETIRPAIQAVIPEGYTFVID